MDLDWILAARAATQRLVGEPCTDVPTAVRHLLAVQSQDFGPAGWSVAQRCSALRESDFVAGFGTGQVLRSHVLRPTWHLVHPGDLRWLLRLTGPRIQRVNASMYRKLGLDSALLDRCARLIHDGLAVGPLTRQQLGGQLTHSGIAADGQRLAYVLMHAELEQVVCSGPMVGRQHTYQRFDDRVPVSSGAFDRDQALRDLAVRYFTGHGPATVRELARWASLTQAEARVGVDSAGEQLVGVEVAGGTFHMSTGTASLTPPRLPGVLLLQPYDEVLMGGATGVPLNDDAGRITGGAWPRFNALVLVGGQVAGSWRRTVRKGSVDVEVALFDGADAAVLRGLEEQAEQLARYLEVDRASVMPVEP